MYFSDLASTLQHISADEKAVFVSGLPGSGKTFAALQFCAEHKESLYFSFYKDVIFDTSPVAGKVYKNSKNRRKQGVSCGFRCICRCSIGPIRPCLERG